ncbi:MAG: 6-phosphogluconolactonase [Acidobacteriaceae bacterium]|nr:6-phosphogluconolactonase [Acidobacteriaceae bacterium]
MMVVPSMMLHPYNTTAEMGQAAAQHAAASIRSIAERQETIPVVFATGASQLATLRALTAIPNVPWDRVTGFHMDEYIGISDRHKASFRGYLREELTSCVPLRKFYEVEGEASDPEAFCRHYADLLQKWRPQLCLLGIGENGHLAFNDPPVADFDDTQDVKITTLDPECRAQQVAEGWFGSIEEVPAQAITLTIPALLRIPELILSVPGERKQRIVERTLREEISTRCPATILRNHPNAHLYVDGQSYRPGPAQKS